MKIDMDLTDVNVEETEFKALPEGKYRAMITESEYKPTANGLGKCLHLRFAILGGDHADRMVMDFLTLEHTNETAVRIAKEKLKKLALAVGIDGGHINDSDDLHYKALTLFVAREKSDNDYGDADGFQNRVKKYTKASPNGASAEELSGGAAKVAVDTSWA